MSRLGALCVGGEWTPSREVTGKYGWTKDNHHFVLASHDSLAFGGGGAFALYLDSSLEFGSSHPSPTFGSQCLAGASEFKVIKVEVWGFV